MTTQEVRFPYSFFPTLFIGKSGVVCMMLQEGWPYAAEPAAGERVGIDSLGPQCCCKLVASKARAFVSLGGRLIREP